MSEIKWKSRTSWNEKLHRDNSKIVDVPPKWEKRFGKGKMCIARPLDIDELVRKTKKGKLITQTRIREKLAEKYKVEHACPLTTGIFVRIVAEAAEEARAEGKKHITPWWRVVKEDGSLNEKLPGATKYQAKLLRGEGHKVVAGKGKKKLRVVVST